MDKAIFDMHLDERHFVPEKLSCLEAFIFAASIDRTHRFRETHLMDHEVGDFVDRTGDYKHEGAECVSSMRLILQKNVTLPETFEARNLSIRRPAYEKMVQTMNLPFSWIETSSCVGPFFWFTLSEIAGVPHFQMIYRKSDVRKNNHTRGWELVLSHDIRSSVTTGYYKGTESSNMLKCLELLQKCAMEIDHPMLLPVLICSQELSMGGDINQRENRETVRGLEKTVTKAAETYAKLRPTKEDSPPDAIELADINKILVDCHCKVLWKRPEVYLKIASTMQEALSSWSSIEAQWPDNLREQISSHQSMLESRLEFLKVKLEGLSSYTKVTIARLEMLQGLVQNLVSLSIARSQTETKMRRAARRSTIQREEMKEKDIDSRRKKQRELQLEVENRKSVSIALLGVFFLPGAFIATIFSTTFFDFHAEGDQPIISPWFWVYWVMTIPITLVVLGLWYLWHRRTKVIIEKKTKEMDAEEEEEQDKIKAIKNEMWRDLLADFYDV